MVVYLSDMKLLRYEEALVDLDTCLSLDPRNTKSLLRKADIYLKIHKKQNALEIYEEIESKDEKNCSQFVKEQIGKLRRELKVEEKNKYRGNNSNSRGDKSSTKELENDLAKLIIPKKIVPSKSKQLVETFQEMKSKGKQKKRVSEPTEKSTRIKIEEL